MKSVHNLAEHLFLAACDRQHVDPVEKHNIHYLSWLFMTIPKCGKVQEICQPECWHFFVNYHRQTDRVSPGSNLS